MTPFLQVLDVIEIGETPAKVRAMDIEGFTPIIDFYSNDGQMPMGSRDIPRAGAVHMRGSFSMQVAGSGTAGTPPAEHDLLLACGLDYTNSPATSDTYVVLAGEAPTQTAVSRFLGERTTAQKHSISNVVANARWEFLPNQPVKVFFDMVGTYNAPSAANPAASLATSATPVVAKALTATIASDTYVLKRVNFDLGNEFDAPNEDIAGTNGVNSPNIVDKIPTAEVEFELPALSTQNYWTDAISENGVAISIALGGTAGNIATFTMTGYINGEINVTQVNKKHHLVVPLAMGWDSNEPFKIVYT